MQGAVPHETLPLEQPPIAYYSAPCEDLERQPPPRLTSGRAKQRAEAASAAVPPALTAA